MSCSETPNPDRQPPSAVTADDPATALFTSFAKVYTMNPNNKSFWLPSSTAVVPVSFYFDKHRSVYRIISYEKKDLVVNSTIFPSMAFIKTSATFGLWSDTKLRTIYGLGFTSSEGLTQFSEHFEEVLKAAKNLEDNLPLPPPATSAVSVGCNSSRRNTASPGERGQSRPNPPTATTKWNVEDCGIGDQYQPPKTVHVVDSKLKIPTGGDGDYEVGQMITSPVEKLALENLQYQREVLRGKQLEVERQSLQHIVSSLHETLQRKSIDNEKLRKDLCETREDLSALKLEAQTNQEAMTKLKNSEDTLKRENDNLKTQIQDKDQKLAENKEEIRYLKGEVDKAEGIRKENDILKERLRQLQTEFDMADKNWDSVEIATCDMTGIIQGLIRVQERLKEVIPVSSSGDM